MILGTVCIFVGFQFLGVKQPTDDSTVLAKEENRQCTDNIETMSNKSDDVLIDEGVDKKKQGTDFHDLNEVSNGTIV